MNRKLIAVVALCATSLSTISTPANAAVTLLASVPDANPGAVVLDGMQATCDAAAAAADTDGAGGDEWTGEVVIGAVTLAAGPTETGSHSIGDAIGNPVGAGTFTPAHKDILGDPFRNGGSVNMFGIQEAVGGHYSASTYDFDGEFTTTYAHAYTCDLSKALYHPEVNIHHDAEGVYVNYDDGHGNDENAARNNCAQWSDHTQPWWGDTYRPSADVRHCIFQGTAAYDEHHDAYNDEPVFDHSVAGGSINVDQTDTLLAHESAGEGFNTSETLLLGQVVVCISPKKLPGTWTTQNGYTGSKCTTAWYTSGATVGVTNLNTGSHNWVTVPVV